MKKLFGARRNRFKADSLEEDIDMMDGDDSDDATVISVNNKIYFYSEVNTLSVLNLKKKISRLNIDLLHRAIECECDANTPIYLHINSPGGYCTDGFLAMDSVLQSKIPIYTIVDGCAASAATFISCVGTKRMINKNSVMLIHQLSGATWGTYSDMEDDMKNSKLLMKKITDIYKAHTKIPAKKLDQILKHDLYFDANTCKKYGLVDEIIG